ncbi:MAG TPA: hypothetical protein VNO35_18905 [Steroidobacteraceae bacterium]|nr:hypothetical protein [Steroidobacteraceae bacterium]
MIYLLDVNVLLAVSYEIHDLHKRTVAWLTSLEEADPPVRLATCSITELGFIRVAGGAAGLTQNVNTALGDLNRLKKQRPMMFLNDGLPGDQLPQWVAKPKHVTDGHLLQLAAVYGGVFATLDSGIPGALLIPGITTDPPFVRERIQRYGAAA